jgi:hypothetical protein
LGLFHWSAFRRMRHEADRRQQESGRNTRRESSANLLASSSMSSPLLQSQSQSQWPSLSQAPTSLPLQTTNNNSSISGRGGGGKGSVEQRVNDPKARYKTWSAAGSGGGGGNGVSTYKAYLQPGIDFQFKIIATQPSRDYLEKTLPQNIKTWIGMS